MRMYGTGEQEKRKVHGSKGCIKSRRGAHRFDDVVVLRCTLLHDKVVEMVAG